MIRLARVEKRYSRESLALQNVSCHVGRGELVFLVGPSGAGKTSLLRLLLGEERPTAGEVLVCGQNVGHLSAHEVRLLRRKIGVVLQEPLLLPDLTVEENVTLPLRISQVPSRQHRQRVAGMLERLDVHKLAHRLPPTLSAGEAQRVAIARALVTYPSLVLADEPTGNLDPGQAREVLQLLLERTEEGMTLLVATHDSTLCRSPRARLIGLEGGRLRGELLTESAR